MGVFIEQIVNGLTIGSFYALIALGYTMVYGVMKLINFAHGDLFALGAYAGYTLLVLGSAFTSCSCRPRPHHATSVVWVPPFSLCPGISSRFARRELAYTRGGSMSNKKEIRFQPL